MAESATPPHMDTIPLWVSRFLSSCSVVSTVIVLSNAGLQPLLERYLFHFFKESYLLYSIDIVTPPSPLQFRHNASSVTNLECTHCAAVPIPEGSVSI